MSEELGKIATAKIPASQAIPGNPEHAQMMQQAGIGGPPNGGAPQKRENGTWAKAVNTGVFGPSLFGVLVLAGFFSLFGFWAASAPLSGAAVAPGFVSASGQNLTVQHFEGGIIKKILVREGETVEAGQPLLTLDPTDAQAMRDRLSNAKIAFKLREARLEAARDGTELKFSPELVAMAKLEGLQNDLEEQRREFEKRNERYDTDARIVDQQVEALKQQITGYELQSKATEEQIKVLSQEIRIKDRLVKRKLTPISTLLALQRNRSELGGRLGGFAASIGDARSRILQAAENKNRLLEERSEKSVTELNEVRRQMADTEARIESAENVLKRVVVRAPSAGVVVNINKNTPGSVVRQGEDLVVLLPIGGELIVEARLSPIDVDVVTVGQTANLRFSALNTRTTPEVEGKVTYVSADRLVDPQTQEPYYTARLEISQNLPDSIKREQIFPGMPVETYIQTGDRTFLEYLVKPMTDSFSRAFREE